MSNKERAIQIIDALPESKMIFVVDMLNSIKNLIEEETEPDEWDMKMIEEAGQENDGTTISLEEILKKDGLTYVDIQD